jgi:hypothetical protein
MTTPVLLLIPGMFNTPAIWDPVIAALRDLAVRPTSASPMC